MKLLIYFTKKEKRKKKNPCSSSKKKKMKVPWLMWEREVHFLMMMYPPTKNNRTNPEITTETEMITVLVLDLPNSDAAILMYRS